MPAAQPQFELRFAAIPAGWRGTPSQYKDLLQSVATVSMPQGFLTGWIQENRPPNNSGLWFKPSTGTLYYWNATAADYVAQPLGTDVGEVKWFTFSALDLSRYVPCDGGAIPRIAPYDVLYAAIGTKFGTGDGSSTFNVPDLRGRTPLGSGTGVIPGVGGAASTTLTIRALGDVIGEETHALLPAEGPTLDVTGTKGSSTAELVKGYSGNGAAHNNMQPSLVLTAAIRYA